MSGLVSIGVLSKSVRDQWMVLKETAGPCPGDLGLQCQVDQSFEQWQQLSQSLKGLRIAICLDINHLAHPECQQAVEKTAQLC